VASVRAVGVTRIIPELRSQNVAATEDLYVTVLGLEVKMRDDASGFLSFGSAENPSAQVIVNDNGHDGLPPGFAIDVGDAGQVDAIHAEVVRRALPIVEPLSTKAWGIRRFSFIDPNGERITVVAHTGEEAGADTDG